MTRNAFKTAILLAGLGGLMVLIGSFFGATGMVIGLALGLALVGASYWFSDRLALRAARAVPVGEADQPEYYRIVRELTEMAELPLPCLYITPDAQPNAFATGRDPSHAAVAVTTGLLETLDARELRGVLAHELSHIRHRDILIGSVAAAVATGISFVANIAMWGAAFGGGSDNRNANPFSLLVMALVAPIAAALLQLAVSRNREFEADRAAAELLGTGTPLAAALLTLDRAAHAIPLPVEPAQASKYIVNPLAGRRTGFSRLFNTHPPVEQRVARLLEWSDADATSMEVAS